MTNTVSPWTGKKFSLAHRRAISAGLRKYNQKMKRRKQRLVAPPQKPEAKPDNLKEALELIGMIAVIKTQVERLLK
mgnify:FL=1